MSGVMKSLETGVGPPEGHRWTLLEPLQFASHANRLVNDAVTMGLHYILQHRDQAGTHARILFEDFSSAFDTIIPGILLTQLTRPSVPTSICLWIIRPAADSEAGKTHISTGPSPSALELLRDVLSPLSRS